VRSVTNGRPDREVGPGKGALGALENGTSFWGSVPVGVAGNTNKPGRSDKELERRNRLANTPQ
jgi:hypothetical protein